MSSLPRPAPYVRALPGAARLLIGCGPWVLVLLLKWGYIFDEATLLIMLMAALSFPASIKTEANLQMFLIVKCGWAYPDAVKKMKCYCDAVYPNTMVCIRKIRFADIYKATVGWGRLKDVVWDEMLGSINDPNPRYREEAPAVVPQEKISKPEGSGWWAKYY